ncbi:MAG TPA: peptidase S13 [Chromatiales bacterium]|nr:peptidase S13 [Thiotrichales bacterium]HIP67733.1 peptidase S13 [Chromatiales bacterium]
MISRIINLCSGFALSLLLLVTPVHSESRTPMQRLQLMQNASLLVENNNGHALQSLRANQPMIPASTLKLLTALMALETWGAEFRFHTDFFLDKNNHLWVKGYGDPMLISEEIDLIVMALKNNGLNEINGLSIDNSYFSKNIIIDGQSQTNNPYDASLSALAANFNTVFVERKNHVTFSAEPQTPLTPLANKLSSNLKSGKHRINLGRQNDGAQYFAEVLREKLIQQGVTVTGKIINAAPPEQATCFYRHYNSRPLSEILKGMLEYSNNFIANQLFLMMGAEKFGAPADMTKSRQAVNQFIEKKFNWRDYRIVEGAGLSRNNRLSARQLVEVLNKLAAYADMLPSQKHNIRAKTGTLQNISSYAGYILTPGQLKTFALIINQPVEHDFRLHLAESL